MSKDSRFYKIMQVFKASVTKSPFKDSKKPFIESYFFYPNIWQKILSFMLLPISFFYFLIAFSLKTFGRKKDFGVKIISVGNLVSGGTGKTPFVIALCHFLESRLDSKDIYIILRGYKRASSGLVVVRDNTSVRSSVTESGDEAMLIAQNVRANVIVCERRALAIKRACAQNARVIILDDGYRFRFKKFDILLRPLMQPYFPFVLPSGYYRLPPRFYKRCDLLLNENADYTRLVDVVLADSIESKLCFKAGVRFILASAIANPSRLAFFTQNLNVIHTYFLSDHDNFSEEILQNLLEKYDADYILMTQKDYVKCETFSLPIALLRLRMKIDSNALQQIANFINC